MPPVLPPARALGRAVHILEAKRWALASFAMREVGLGLPAGSDAALADELDEVIAWLRALGADERAEDEL